MAHCIPLKSKGPMIFEDLRRAEVKNSLQLLENAKTKLCLTVL
jgi:hypothetical protein